MDKRLLLLDLKRKKQLEGAMASLQATLLTLLPIEEVLVIAQFVFDCSLIKFTLIANA